MNYIFHYLYSITLIKNIYFNFSVIYYMKTLKLEIKSILTKKKKLFMFLIYKFFIQFQKDTIN